MRATTYALQDREPLPQGVRRIAAEQLDGAIDQLRGRGNADRDEAVHDARKRCKKTRALLRLVRGEIGEEAYKRENVCLRDAGRRLADVRDAQILVETFASFADHELAGVSQLAVEGVRDALDTHRDIVRREVLDEQGGMPAVATEIEAARKRIDSWPLERDDFEALRPGLRKVYRRGRRRYVDALAEPTVERLHEWRKRSKYLWYAARILRNAAPRPMAKLIERTDGMGSLLGDDHDLAVLRPMVSDLAWVAGDADAVEGILAAIDRRRATLARAAVPLGELVYAERPSAFVERIAGYWGAWREQAPRRGRWAFTRFEAAEVRRLLTEKDGGEPAGQSYARAALRRRGFYISDFGSLARTPAHGFRRADFDRLVRRGFIRVE